MKFGIIGTNFVSDSFMDGLQKVEGAYATAVTSGRYENAVRFAEKYGIHQVVEQYEDLIYSDIDAVYIATPNAMHYEMAAYFLTRQIPVFLEKPLCVNVEEAKNLYALAKQYNTYLHDGLMPLYIPALQQIKQALPSLGPLRNVSLIFSKYSSRYDAYLRGENPTTFRKELGNGAMNDLGIYPLGVAIALFGVPKQVFGAAVRLESGVDGACDAILAYEGFNVVLQVSKISDSAQKNEISGEHGTLSIEGISLLSKAMMHLRHHEDVEIASNQENPFVYQIENFMNVVKYDAPPLCGEGLSLAILETLEAIRNACNITY